MSKLWKLDSIKQAAKLFEKNAEEWEKINEPRKAVLCLNEAAKLAQVYADFETAFLLLGKAIKIAKKNNLTEEESISLSIYAFFSNENNDQKTSQKFSRRALLLSEKSNSPRAKAYSHFCRGIYEYYNGKMKAATVFFEQSAVYAQETQDIFIISQTLFYVGFAYIREGYSYKAVEKMNLALQLCEKFGYKKGQALSYFGIAASYYYIEKQKALDFLIKAESLFPTDFEWLEKARIATTIGNLYLDLGEFELAKIYFKKAIPNHEKSNYLLGKITTLTLLADTYFLKGELKDAKETYETALTLSTLSGDKFRSAVIKEGLGNINFAEHDLDAAARHYYEALREYNVIGVRLPLIENRLGKIYILKGNHKKAREFYDSALKTNRQTKDYVQLSETLFNFAKLQLIEKNTNEALFNVTESIDLTENLYSNVANSKLKSSYFSSVFDRYEFYINLLMKKHSQSPDKNYAIAALQATEKSRARSMLENLSLADFTKDVDPEMSKREKEIRALLNTKADKLVDLLSENAEKSVTDKISGEIKELENETANIKATLKQNSPIYSAIKNPAPFDVGEFQRDVLDENSLLLEFSFGKEESYLWLVSKTEVNSYVLPPREQIESRIERLRKLIDSRGMLESETVESYQARISEAENTYELESKQLSDELFGQAADKLSNKRLIIVPDGKLHYFPVAALPFPNSSDNQPILLTNEVVYEPSAATLALLMRNGRKTSAATKNLLVFSDPIFSNQDARVANTANVNEIEPAENSLKVEKFRFAESLTSLVRLNASKDEADSIIEIVGASDSTMLSGAMATRERALDASISDYKIIHFATHGLIKEDRPELSGIVLSQVDEAGQDRNGVVRLQDIYAMNLSADAVVLSACSTGIGKEVKGEGLMSLNNAFLQTGAKSVVSSLWKVDDYAAQELMKNFYRELATGKVTTSESLRRAQINLRENPQYQSPFYWAAFTIQGDYKTVPQFSKEFDYRIFGLLIFPFAMLGVYLYRRRLN